MLCHLALNNVGFNLIHEFFRYEEQGKEMNPKLFREAAKRIANEEEFFCCNALERLDYTNKAGEFFAKYFQPELLTYQMSWFSKDPSEDGRLTRTLALLFCAEIAKSKK